MTYFDENLRKTEGAAGQASLGVKIRRALDEGMGTMSGQWDQMESNGAKWGHYWVIYTVQMGRIRQEGPERDAKRRPMEHEHKKSDKQRAVDINNDYARL